jgi:hypothetical protein
MSVVCCQVEVSATRWSLVQRSPTDCGAPLSVIKKPHEWGGPGPRGAEAKSKIKIKYKYTRLLVCVGAKFCKSVYSTACTKFKAATGTLPNNDVQQIASRLLTNRISKSLVGF